MSNKRFGMVVIHAKGANPLKKDPYFYCACHDCIGDEDYYRHGSAKVSTEV